MYLYIFYFFKPEIQIDKKSHPCNWCLYVCVSLSLSNSMCVCVAYENILFGTQTTTNNLQILIVFLCCSINIFFETKNNIDSTNNNLRTIATAITIKNFKTKQNLFFSNIIWQNFRFILVSLFPLSLSVYFFCMVDYLIHAIG